MLCANRLRVRRRANRSDISAYTRIGLPKGGAAEPVIENGRSDPTTVRW